MGSGLALLISLLGGVAAAAHADGPLAVPYQVPETEANAIKAAWACGEETAQCLSNYEKLRTKLRTNLNEAASDAGRRKRERLLAAARTLLPKLRALARRLEPLQSECRALDAALAATKGCSASDTGCARRRAALAPREKALQARLDAVVAAAAPELGCSEGGQTTACPASDAPPVKWGDLRAPRLNHALSSRTPTGLTGPFASALCQVQVEEVLFESDATMSAAAEARYVYKMSTSVPGRGPMTETSILPDYFRSASSSESALWKVRYPAFPFEPGPNVEFCLKGKISQKPELALSCTPRSGGLGAAPSASQSGSTVSDAPAAKSVLAPGAAPEGQRRPPPVTTRTVGGG